MTVSQVGQTLLQETIVALQEQQEAGLVEMQGLVVGATALPRQQVQPLFAALGKRHLDLKQHHLTLQQQPALVSNIISHIGRQRCFSTQMHCPWQITLQAICLSVIASHGNAYRTAWHDVHKA